MTMMKVRMIMKKNSIEDYEEYLRKYISKHHVSREEAEKHLIVMAYRRECEENDDYAKIYESEEEK